MGTDYSGETTQASQSEAVDSPERHADSDIDVANLVALQERAKEMTAALEQKAEGLLSGYYDWISGHGKELASLAEDNLNGDPLKHGEPNKCVYVSADGQKREVYFVRGRLWIVNPDSSLTITIPAPLRYETLTPEKLHTRPSGQEPGFEFKLSNTEDSSGFFLSTKDRSRGAVWKKPNAPDPLRSAADNLRFLQDPTLRLESSTPVYQAS